MLTLYKLLSLYGLSSNKVRFVRHSNSEINVLDTFLNQTQRFTEYAAWQNPNTYRDAEYILMFAPDKNSRAIFLGLWQITGVTKNKDLTQNYKASLADMNLFPEWFATHDYYHLKLSSIMFDLSQRLVVDWGKSTISWVQQKDKTVFAITPENAIREFESYDQVHLSYADMRTLVQDPNANSTWINALSNVNGIYLIRDLADGKQYVGSAYGKLGIFARWKIYASNGHGGNKSLLERDPINFKFSILEICSTTMSASDVISRENRWKEVLGSQIFGLNQN